MLRGMMRSCSMLVLLAAACGGEPPPEQPIRPVRVVEVVTSAGGVTRTFSGSVQARVESKLSFKVQGTILSLPVKVGDRIVSGQVLAEMDPRDFELQVEEAEASLSDARARARNAEASLERVRGLYENNNASQADYDAARATRDSADAQVQSLSRRLDLARAQLSYTTLTAPQDGSISEVEREVNENVSPGQPVMTLVAEGSPEVRVAVPEASIGRVSVGQEVNVKLDALPGETFTATVTEVATAATGLATTFPVTARLEASSPEVRVGMAAEVTFRFPSTEGRILLPASAVGEDRQGRFVYVASPSADGFGTVSRRPVTVGDLTSGGLEILGGLTDGELVVTAGVSRIEDGQRVRVPSVTPES